MQNYAYQLFLYQHKIYYRVTEIKDRIQKNSILDGILV